MFCVGLDAQLKMNELGKLELILVRPVHIVNRLLIFTMRKIFIFNQVC